MNDLAGQSHCYRVSLVSEAPSKTIFISFANVDKEATEKEQLRQKACFDRLSGLWNHSTFCAAVGRIQKEDPAGIAAGEYAMIYFDLVKFKAINDIFGILEGDKVLRYIGGVLKQSAGERDVCGCLGGDRFLVFAHLHGQKLTEYVEEILGKICSYNASIPLACSAGIYVTCREMRSSNSMIDRAVLAQSAIKGSYTQRYRYYDESLRTAMLSEREIAGMMEEALVRWRHPEKGLISPGWFIPIFEKNGFISRLVI